MCAGRETLRRVTAREGKYGTDLGLASFSLHQSNNVSLTGGKSNHMKFVQQFQLILRNLFFSQ